MFFLFFPILSFVLLYLIHLNSPYFGLFHLILFIFVLLWCDGGVTFSFVSILHNGTNSYILQAINRGGRQASASFYLI